MFHVNHLSPLSFPPFGGTIWLGSRPFPPPRRFMQNHHGFSGVSLLLFSPSAGRLRLPSHAASYFRKTHTTNSELLQSPYTECSSPHRAQNLRLLHQTPNTYVLPADLFSAAVESFLSYLLQFLQAFLPSHPPFFFIGIGQSMPRLSFLFFTAAVSWSDSNGVPFPFLFLPQHLSPLHYPSVLYAALSFFHKVLKLDRDQDSTSFPHLFPASQAKRGQGLPLSQKVYIFPEDHISVTLYSSFPHENFPSPHSRSCLQRTGIPFFPKSSARFLVPVVI